MRQLIVTCWYLVLCLLLATPVHAADAAKAGLSIGDEFTLALRTDGKVYAWGTDTAFQLGAGRKPFSLTPIPVAALTGVASISKRTLSQHTAAVLADGTVWTWGDNLVGQLGVRTGGNATVPLQVLGIDSVAAASVGESFTLALKTDGTVWSWGYDSVALGRTGVAGAPGRITALSSIAAISAGGSHALALAKDGSVWAWGANTHGMLGDGTTTERRTPRKITGMTGIVAVSAGATHSLALRSDGLLYVWGSNGAGELGDGTTTTRLAPTVIFGISGVAAIDAGYQESLAVKKDGTVQSLAGAGGSAPAPAAVAGISGAAAVSSGFGTRLALKADGTVMAWGQNLTGLLGDGTISSNETPQAIAGLSNIKQAWLGKYSAAALARDGKLYVWGGNSTGELGFDVQTFRTLPGEVGSLDPAVQVAAGPHHTLALLADGTVRIWGTLLVDCSCFRVETSAPVQVPGLSNIVAVAAGHEHNLALRSDGIVFSWGMNQYGQLGYDNSTNATFLPRAISGLTGVTAIAAGQGHSMALLSDGSVRAWGLNASGQVGDGSTVNRITPVRVSGLPGTTTRIAAGANHSLAIAAGSVFGWGANAYGQVGNGTQANQSAPVLLPGSDFTGIAAGRTHSIAVNQLGVLYTWGDNRYGALGNGGGVQLAPVAVSGNLPSFTAVAAGAYSSGALAQGGSLWTWGTNAHGELGDGTLAYRSRPVLVANSAATGPLDLTFENGRNIPASQIPPFWLNTARDVQSLDKSTAIAFATEDQGKAGMVYVTAVLDASSPLLATATAEGRVQVMGERQGATGTQVNAVLTRTGWKQSSQSQPTEPLYSGNLTPDSGRVVLRDTSEFDTSKDSGVFCVAYVGSGAGSTKGLIRSVLSGADHSVEACPPVVAGYVAPVAGPPVPSGVTATAAGPGAVALTWNTNIVWPAIYPPIVSGYKVYRDTKLVATLGAVTSYRDAGLTSSTRYSYGISACNQSQTCSDASAAVTAQTATAPLLQLAPGWNLAGNGGATALPVAPLFSNSAAVVAVWRWAASGTQAGVRYPAWAFYSPALADGGAAYAASQGYEALASIPAGAGFWVHAKAAANVQLPEQRWLAAREFQAGQGFALAAGWHLVASGEGAAMRAFHTALATQSNGTVAATAFGSAWAWDAVAGRWYYYAPALDAQGTLAAYLAQKGYADFGTPPLGAAQGLWIYIP